MTKVLYIAGEMTEDVSTAAQVRIRALLPRLDKAVSLRVIGFSPTGELRKPSGLDLRAPVEMLSMRNVTRGDLIKATLRTRPRSFSRYDTDRARSVLSAALREFQPDIVHFDGFATLGLMEVVERDCPSARMIAHINDAQSLSQSRITLGQGATLGFTVQNKIEHLKALSFEKHRLGRAALTLVDSIEDRDFLNAIVKPGRVSLLPLGFEIGQYSSTGEISNIAQPAIMFSGSMKGIQTVDGAVFLAKDVMPLVWRSRPDAHLYLVGGNPAPEISALAGANIHVTGFVDDLASYLRASRVYACALRLGSGMRTRVVEALACGTTMVANSMSVRGLVEPLHGAPWVIANNAEDFAREIVGVLEGGHAEMGKIAASYAKAAYSWDCVADQLLNYYAEEAEK